MIGVHHAVIITKNKTICFADITRARDFVAVLRPVCNVAQYLLIVECRVMDRIEEGLCLAAACRADQSVAPREFAQGFPVQQIVMLTDQRQIARVQPVVIQYLMHLQLPLRRPGRTHQQILRRVFGNIIHGVHRIV